MDHSFIASATCKQRYLYPQRMLQQELLATLMVLSLACVSSENTCKVASISCPPDIRVQLLPDHSINNPSTNSFEEPFNSGAVEELAKLYRGNENIINGAQHLYDFVEIATEFWISRWRIKVWRKVEGLQKDWRYTSRYSEELSQSINLQESVENKI